MTCAGCRRELQVGERYIRDTASAFVGVKANPIIDGLVAELMGGTGSEVVFCEDCTTQGGEWRFDTVYGDEDVR